MAISDELAIFLAGKKDTKSGNTTAMFGTAAADSSGGSVPVLIPGAEVILPEGSTGDNSVEVPIMGKAKAGDQVMLLNVGNGVADTPVVIGAFGDDETAPIPHVLYSSSGSYGTITLADDITAYDYVDILYKDTGDICGSVRIADPYVGQAFDCTTFHPFSAASGITYKTRCVEVSTATQLSTRTDGGARLNVLVSTYGIDAGDYIAITKVIGYR